MSKIKTIIIHTLVLFFIMSMFGCKDDVLERNGQPISTHKIHLDFTSPLNKDINVIDNTTRAVSLNLSTSKLINWSSDTWNNSDKKPKLFVVVKNNDGSTFLIKQLENSEYEYNKDRSNQLTVNCNIDVPSKSNKIIFYLFDKSISPTISSNKKSGTIPFSGNSLARDPYTSIINSSNGYFRTIPYNVFVEPNRNILFNFIFTTSIKISSSGYSGGQVSFHPLGALLKVDFYSKDGSIIDNPSHHEDFSLDLRSDMFKLSGDVDMSTGASSNRADWSSINVKFLSYSTIDFRPKPIYDRGPDKISDSGYSQTFVKYVLLNRESLGNSDYLVNFLKPNTDSDIFSKSVSKDYNAAEKYNGKSLAISIPIEDSDIPKHEPDPVVPDPVIPDPTPDPYQPPIPEPEPEPEPWGEFQDYHSYNPLDFMSDQIIDKNHEIETITPYYTNNPGYFTYYEAINILNGMGGFHLPSEEEWCGIFPRYADTDFVLFNKSTEIRKLYDPPISFGYTMLRNTTSYYQTIRSNDPELPYITYAIKFVSGEMIRDEDGHYVHKYFDKQNSPCMSIWIYSYRSETNTSIQKNFTTVQCQVLKPGTYINTSGHKMRVYINGMGWLFIDDMRLWDTHNSDNITKYIYCNGYQTEEYKQYPPAQVGLHARYWGGTSGTGSWSNKACNIGVNNQSVGVGYENKNDLLTIRPFIDPLR